MGVLTNTEVLLSEVTRGKRVLRSILLPRDVGELNSLLEWLWQSKLAIIWVQPGSTLSQTLHGSQVEEAAPHWNVIIHPAPHEPTRLSNALLWPKGSGREARRPRRY